MQERLSITYVQTHVQGTSDNLHRQRLARTASTTRKLALGLVSARAGNDGLRALRLQRQRAEGLDLGGPHFALRLECLDPAVRGQVGLEEGANVVVIRFP